MSKWKKNTKVKEKKDAIEEKVNINYNIYININNN